MSSFFTAPHFAAVRQFTEDTATTISKMHNESLNPFITQQFVAVRQLTKNMTSGMEYSNASTKEEEATPLLGPDQTNEPHLPKENKKDTSTAGPASKPQGNNETENDENSQLMQTLQALTYNRNTAEARAGALVLQANPAFVNMIVLCKKIDTSALCSILGAHFRRGVAAIEKFRKGHPWPFTILVMLLITGMFSGVSIGILSAVGFTTGGVAAGMCWPSISCAILGNLRTNGLDPAFER